MCDINELLKISTNHKDGVRAYYNVTEKDIKEFIILIREWLLKQPHLPQNIDDIFIENVLLRNKFRVEKTKQKIDNYFTIRGSHLDLFKGYENLQPIKENSTYLPLPQLTENKERINLITIRSPDEDLYDISSVVKIDLAFGELVLRHDYAVGDKYVFDFANFGLKHIAKVNPVLLSKHAIIFQKAYSCRILGIELINLPPFASKIVGLFKLILPNKLYGRLRTHDSLESLYKVIPREILPSEYGGDAGKVDDLLKKWDSVFAENRKFLAENLTNISNEDLRIKQHNDFERLDGTFRKLDID